MWRKGNKGKQFKPEDIAKSLLYAISNNIGQIAYMNAEKHNLDHIYFGGCFIRGHAATISTLSYAIRFWSKGTKKALFLRHEGYLGAIGEYNGSRPGGHGLMLVNRRMAAEYRRGGCTEMTGMSWLFHNHEIQSGADQTFPCIVCKSCALLCSRQLCVLSL